MLTKKQLQELPPGRHLLEPNLYIRVRSETSRYYIFLYQFQGQRKELKLGNFDDISISQVREEVAKCRLLIAKGIDPKYARMERRKIIKEKLKRQISLREYYEKILPDILNAKQFKGAYSRKVYTQIPFKHVMPILGSMPISEIKVEDVARCLKPIWEKIPTTANYARTALQTTFAYAKKEGYYAGDNPAAFPYNLDMYLPAISKIHEKQHMRYASNEVLIDFLKHLAVWHYKFPHVTLPVYILLTAVLACRANESIFLSWTEIDLDDRTITLPKERKKFKKGDPFVMPLSTQAIWLLNEIRKVNTDSTDLIFRRNSNTRLHQGNVTRFMADMPTCLHGFRTSFRNFCLRDGISDMVAEISLMHAYGENETVRSYLRDDVLDLRRDAMQRWADFILPMEVLTGDFLTVEQKQKLDAIPYKVKGRGWDGIWEDQWGLGLREDPQATKDTNKDPTTS